MTTPRALPFCHAKKVTDTLRLEERADVHLGTKRSISTAPHEVRHGPKADMVTLSPEFHYAPQLARVERSAVNEFKSQANLAKLGCFCAKRFCNALWSTGFCNTGAFAYLLVKACGPYPVMNANGTFLEARMSATG